MLNYDTLVSLGKQLGFRQIVPLDPETIDLKPEVREMCAANTCGMFGKCWSCPPGCGTLEECRSKIAEYPYGILVQTVGELEDPLDGEGMIEARDRHKENFQKMHEALRGMYPHVLAIGAGACGVCESCTYPGQPCRFPDKCITSMEAYGMLVLEVCKKNNLTYYYGPNTISYTSCLLFK